MASDGSPKVRVSQDVYELAQAIAERYGLQGARQGIEMVMRMTGQAVLEGNSHRPSQSAPVLTAVPEQIPRIQSSNEAPISEAASALDSALDFLAA